MVEFSKGSDVYSIKRLKQKIQEHYKEYIFFATVEGRDNVVCFKNMAEYVINQKWQSSKLDDTNSAGSEAERIVKMAAKIIRDEIRESEAKQYWACNSAVISTSFCHDTNTVWGRC